MKGTRFRSLSPVAKYLIGFVCVAIVIGFALHFSSAGGGAGAGAGGAGAGASSNDPGIVAISQLTDLWIKEVTVAHNPQAIARLFCPDGNLVGTVSQVKRTGTDIERYFDYFANLPGIKVVAKEYKISPVENNVYVNTAFITWQWDGLDKPITARMTFLYRDNCIFQLHSSALPELNEDLLDVTGTS
jgi:hypothetical protein